MKDIGRLLRDGDLVALEPEMSAADVQAMRRAVLAALATTDRATSRWPGPLLAGAAVSAALAAGVFVGLRSQAPRRLPMETALTYASDGEGARRQLQFAAPGGTRIIWVFDSECHP